MSRIRAAIAHGPGFAGRDNCYPKERTRSCAAGYAPGRAVPVLDEGLAVVVRAISADSPDIAAGDPGGGVQGIAHRGDAGAAYYAPRRAVPMQGERLLLIPLAAVGAHGPQVVGRDGLHAEKVVGAAAGIGGRHLGPARAVPVEGK